MRPGAQEGGGAMGATQEASRQHPCLHASLTTLHETACDEGCHPAFVFLSTLLVGCQEFGEHKPRTQGKWAGHWGTQELRFIQTCLLKVKRVRLSLE